MKLFLSIKGIHPLVSIIILLSTLSASEAIAGSMGPAVLDPSGSVYLGLFGGGGESNKIKVVQLGTALYSEAKGGPLAVNVFGELNRESIGFIGGHVGYQWPELPLGQLPLPFLSALAPAAELEGYYISKRTFNGEVSNDTNRLPEHHFRVDYPLKSGVFLTNAIVNFNLTQYSRVHPFIAGGIGGGILFIKDAVATQVAPAEPGVNHYNANPTDTQSTFAAQTKAGLNIDISKKLNLFAEYRWLYLSSTSFEFGSTAYPTHVVTTHWLVKLDRQNYNLGAMGIRYTL